MNVIHLTKRQKKRSAFEHPLLGDAKDLDQKQLVPLLERHFKGDLVATQDIVMGSRGLVRAVVGRFLYHWPETRRFEEDMVSEGFTALVQIMETLTLAKQGHLRPMMVMKIKLNIEIMLNDMRSQMSASLSTNFQRLKDKRAPEYIYAGQLTEDNNAVGAFDAGPTYVDIMDSLERLQEVDSEEMVDLVLNALEEFHRIKESDLSSKDTELLLKLTKLGGQSV